MLPGLRGLDGGCDTDDSTELEALRQLVDKQARQTDKQARQIEQQARQIEQLHAEKAAEAATSATEPKAKKAADAKASKKKGIPARVR